MICTTVRQTTAVVNRTFDAANQLQTATDTELGTTSFYYDGNGRLVDILPPGVVVEGEGAIRYRFNQRDLLVSQETFMEAEGDWVLQAEFVYDGDANRVQQIDHTGVTPITTTYTNDVVGLSQVLVSSNGVTTTHNLFGLDLIHVDDGSAIRTVLADGLGNGRVEMVGGVVDSATTYEPYGKLLAQTGASGTVYGFTGEQYDALTSLVYLRARYYSPSLKVFLSRDPFPGYATVPASQHGYSYVHNNPVNLIDPSGEVIPLVPLIIGSFVIGVVAAITWDVMVEQGKGGIEHALSGVFFNPCYWKDVNWEQAAFKGAAGGIIGVFAGLGIDFIFFFPKNTNEIPEPQKPELPWDRGNRFHYDRLNGGDGEYGPSQLQEQYPDTEFEFARRGQSGPDVTYSGRGTHPSQYPGSTWPAGSNHGDFKPDTESGARTFYREVDNGKLPEDTVPLPYDPNALDLLDEHRFSNPPPGR